MDIAWSKMIDAAPVMSDGRRYREIMYEVFWLGKEPTLTPEERKRASGGKGAKAPKPTGFSPGDLDTLREMRERAEQLRGEQKG
jgi:hypothetical protein